jgi:hypothetical protein
VANSVLTQQIGSMTWWFYYNFDRYSISDVQMKYKFFPAGKKRHGERLNYRPAEHNAKNTGQTR